MAVNCIFVCPLKPDVLLSFDLESFLLRVAIAVSGNGRPLNIGNIQISYIILAARSALPQLSGQHTCDIGSTSVEQTVNVGVGFFRVNCVNQRYCSARVAIM